MTDLKTLDDVIAKANAPAEGRGKWRDAGACYGPRYDIGSAALNKWRSRAKAAGGLSGLSAIERSQYGAAVASALRQANKPKFREAVFSSNSASGSFANTWQAMSKANMARVAREGEAHARRCHEAYVEAMSKRDREGVDGWTREYDRLMTIKRERLMADAREAEIGRIDRAGLEAVSAALEGLDYAALAAEPVEVVEARTNQEQKMFPIEAKAAKRRAKAPRGPYALKSDAELRFIVRDASEAYEAVRGRDAIAEGKYADQVLEASSEISRRRLAA